jgi:hypothetical protein
MQKLKNNLTLQCPPMTCAHWVNGHLMLDATVNYNRMVQILVYIFVLFYYNQIPSNTIFLVCFWL